MGKWHIVFRYEARLLNSVPIPLLEWVEKQLNDWHSLWVWGLMWLSVQNTWCRSQLTTSPMMPWRIPTLSPCVSPVSHPSNAHGRCEKECLLVDYYQWALVSSRQRGRQGADARKRMYGGLDIPIWDGVGGYGSSGNLKEEVIFADCSHLCKSLIFCSLCKSQHLDNKGHLSLMS